MFALKEFCQHTFLNCCSINANIRNKHMLIDPRCHRSGLLIYYYHMTAVT